MNQITNIISSSVEKKKQSYFFISWHELWHEHLSGEKNTSYHLNVKIGALKQCMKDPSYKPLWLVKAFVVHQEPVWLWPKKQVQSNNIHWTQWNCYALLGMEEKKIKTENWPPVSFSFQFVRNAFDLKLVFRVEFTSGKWKQNL